MNKVAVSNGVSNKQYDALELLELTFKIVNKNKKKVLEYFIKLIVTLIIVLIPIGIVFAILGLVEPDIYNSYGRHREMMDNMEVLFSVGVVLAMVLTMLLFVLYGFAANWFMLKGVTSIDTGIESIDSKKITVPTGSALPKVIVIQMLAGAISIPLSIMLNMTSYMMPLYFLMFIQVNVVTFILGNFVTFSYFEVVAKGKNLSNSVKNAVTNFLFSKNNIIAKIIVGNILIYIVSFVALVLVILFAILIVMIFVYMEIYSIAVVLGVTFTILFFLLIGYLAFYSTTFSYLTYMLNEVKEDKVDKLV